MSLLDWGVLFCALGGFVAFGLWRSRGERNLDDYLLAGRTFPWYGVALSVMATQASAVTFLSTPGQGFADGLRFVQFYFGLPLAMIVLSITVVPIYHRLRVFTAYQYLEQRFDGKTRTLGAALFLLQRGLAAGITLYAPALVLSVILGWPVGTTTLLLALLAVVYTATGGSKAVGHTQMLQFSIIIATLLIAFVVVLRSLPPGVGAGDALALAGAAGRTHALELRFDPNDRYNLWSGLIGGFFLQLAYFGTDQSQVGRYLTGRSITGTRLGLLFNGLVKVPMQLLILSLGVLVFVFYLFHPAPLHFNPGVAHRLSAGPHADEYRALQSDQRSLESARERHAREFLAARHAQDGGAENTARAELLDDQKQWSELRSRTGHLVQAQDPATNPSDTNYVFLSFVLAHLPAGLIGLVFAAIFAASMNSTAAELNALASTTVVDVIQRVNPAAGEGARGLWLSRLVTIGWAGYAVAFAENASRLGSLVEAVNILGSLFYGTLLGIFLTAFYVRRVGGTAVFAGALVAQAIVLACFRFTGISFLWYNLIGCAAVMGVGLLVQLGLGPRSTTAAR